MVACELCNVPEGISNIIIYLFMINVITKKKFYIL